jgi:hypothetical protein
MLKEDNRVKALPGELQRRAEEALRACLKGVPFLEVRNTASEVRGEGGQPDLLVELELAGMKQSLVLEVKRSGQPRLAREAANQLRRYKESHPEAYGVFAAPFVSPRAAEICFKEEIGYVDLSGNCRLCFNRIYIEKQGSPNRFAEKRDLRTLYSPKAQRVLRVLLSTPRKSWKTKDLSEEAQVSLGQVSNVKKLLADREWVRIEAEGFLLSQPEVLLQEWAENYSYKKNRVRDFYTLKSAPEFETELASAYARENLAYALTSFSGAARLAPAVRQQRVVAYVEESNVDIVSLLSIKEVPTGANVSLLAPFDDGVFYGAREIDGIRIVSPIQIYLDLIGFRGRGEEAAAAILEEVIRPQW